LTDGNESFGPLTYTFTTGSVTSSDVQNFDGVTAPALPSGWTTTFSGSGTAATTSTNFSDTAPNNVFLSEAATVGLSEVTSASIPIPAGAGTRLSFRNLYNTEAAFDGLVLEISINGAPFQDIIAAGGTFVSGGYTGTLSTGFSNPLPGRAAWSGLSGGTASAPAYITSVVNLPPAAAGQLIQLKWRQGSDSSVVPATNPGSRIDTIRLSSFVCGGSAPTLVSAVSRKVHGGGAGTFNLPLSLGSIAGNVTTEPRLGAMGNHQLVMTFSAPVTVGSTVVTSGVSGSSTTVAGAEVTVNLTGVENAERVAVTLNNVASGANLGNVMVPVGFLLGDTNNSRAVSGADVSLTKATVGGPVTASTFRSDVNANGFINSADVGLVKSASGTVLP
ncbi:MAG: hypothetical protein H0V56_04180, partial [Chthoniobacterales bacterium]|nr:hypothetical protein [Chthoniobacterales bacterium]